MATSALLNSLGALGTIGSSGGTGAMQGIIEGQGLKRSFQNADLQNSLLALQLLMGQQQMGQPSYQVHGDRMFAFPRAGGPPQVSELPPTAFGEARMRQFEEQQRIADEKIRLAEGRADTYRLKAENPPMSPQAAYIRAIAKGDHEEAARILQGIQELEGTKPVKGVGGRAGGAGSERPFRVGRSLVTPDGRVIFTEPAVPKGAAANVRETVEETTRDTPRKPIDAKSADFVNLNSTIPGIVDEVNAQFAAKGLNFNVPGAFVRLPSGKMIRKEDVIAEAIMKRHGIEASVTWDPNSNPKRFILIKAWQPATHEPVERRRTTTTGPRRSSTAQDDDEE